MKKRIGILVENEMAGGPVKPASLGLLTLADPDMNDLFAIVLNTDVNAAKVVLENSGAVHIIHVDLPVDKQHNPEMISQVVIDIIHAYDISMLFGLSSSPGKNILPRIAAKMDAPLIMDCIDVDTCENTARTSQYSGKTMATFQVSGDFCVFGIRPNVIKAKENKVSAQVHTWEKSVKEVTGFKVLTAGHDNKGAAIALAEADVIIAGGRGMKHADNFNVLFDCAKKINAAVAASRVAVDSGWVPYAMQVGQTGEKVSPKVYIACGISGSIQHFAGMKTSGMVIAVNTDQNAAIISNADYYAIGDAVDIITEVNHILDNG